MRRTVIGMVLVCGCVVFASCFWSASDFKTRDRVESMLHAWSIGGVDSTIEAQEAVCMWWRGKIFIADDIELGIASDKFDKWRRSKGLFRKIESWEVQSIQPELGKEPPSDLVSVVIDGAAYQLRVVPEQPIEWVN